MLGTRVERRLIETSTAQVVLVTQEYGAESGLCPPSPTELTAKCARWP
jgi:hypothetical protein